MIMFEGTYRLRGPVSKRVKISEDPAYCWDVCIIDFSLSEPQVQHIKPTAVVTSPSHMSVFKSTCAETLGKRICRDFKLDVNKVLWIETFPDTSEKEFVAIFTPKFYFGTDIFYDINWRPILENEREAIYRYLPQTPLNAV